MNARVDPTTLAPTSGDDTRLIAMCRAAIKAIDIDIECDELVHAVGADYDARKPPYPVVDPIIASHPSSAHALRKKLKQVPNPLPSWRKNMKAQLAAVVSWERACKAIEKELGLDKIDRQYDRAVTLSRKYVGDVAAIPASTTIGAAWKATVSARWLTAGYSHSADEGEALVLSILDDIRSIGGCKAVERRGAGSRSPSAQVH